MAKLFVSASLMALALVATASPTAAQQVACSARASPGDTAVGIDLITDASCVNGGLGCLGTVCRFCKHRDTPASSHLKSCPASPAATTSAPPAPIAVSAKCAALLAPGDKSVGISIASDAACATKGGVGCIGDSGCRFCRVLETPQSKHLLLCSAIFSPNTESSDTTVHALTQGGEASTSNGAIATKGSAGLLPVAVAVAAAAAVVAVAAFAAKRSRDRAAEDVLVTPTNVIHRNEPLCTL